MPRSEFVGHDGSWRDIPDRERVDEIADELHASSDHTDKDAPHVIGSGHPLGVASPATTASHAGRRHGRFTYCRENIGAPCDVVGRERAKVDAVAVIRSVHP